MRRIHIGYSTRHTADELLELLEYDYAAWESSDAMRPRSKFQDMFGTGNYDPDALEVIGGIESGLPPLTTERLQRLLPQDVRRLGIPIRLLDVTAPIRCMFWIEDDAEWSVSSANGIVITDTLEVDPQ